MNWEELNERMIKDNWGVGDLSSHVAFLEKGKATVTLRFRKRMLSRLNVVRARYEHDMIKYGSEELIQKWHKIMIQLAELFYEVNKNG